MLTKAQIRYRKHKAEVKEYNKKYNDEHRAVIKKRNREWRDLNRFGGLRAKVLERDNYTCQNCGMTNKEHLEKWGREITIDHVDGNGRYAEEQNNLSENLVTMCLACHGRKDVSIRYKE